MSDPNTLNAELPHAVAPTIAPSTGDDAKPASDKSTYISLELQQCRVWIGNTRDVSSDHGPRFESLKASIKNNGQQVPVIGRKVMTSEGRSVFEIVAGKRRFAAIESLAAEGMPVQVRAEARRMDDATAHKLVMSENEGRHGFVPLETALYYRHGLENGLYADQAALAATLGLNKSTVGRTLAILDLPSDVLGKVADRRAISAAQASRFMTHWTDGVSQPVMQACLAILERANAATIFMAVFAEVDSPESKDALRTIDGAAIGTLRSTKTGVKIELSNAAKAVGVEDVVASIRTRMLELLAQD